MIGWDNESGRVLVLDSYGGSVLRCRLDPTGLVPYEQVVGTEWRPAYMCSWPGHDGIVFSGIDPVSSVAGVYWRRPGAATDSLLFAPSGSEVLAPRFSFTADGQHLLLGLNLPVDRTCALVSVPVQPPGVPSVIVTRSHYAIQAEAHPVDPDLAAFVYHFVGDDTNPPEDIVEIVRLSTGDAMKLNVRTYALTCYFTRVESVSWDPTGRNLALASGAEDGEGGTHRFQLWAFRNVPIE
ncbi:MAG TPA: hypothetical protein VFX92_01185 [Candidatus Krumholzibacteria bacterium]|nr:hypothetical protein [Candidatus Krumholzibacteria bacterium]